MMKIILIFIVSMSLLSACNHIADKDGQGSLPVLLSDSARDANCVYLTTDETDQPIISWCETDKASGLKSFYMASFNSDNSFSNRVSIPIQQNANLHEEGMPKVAFKKDGTIIAVYETSSNSEKNRFAGFVHYIVSTDKGKSWSSPAYLHVDTSGEKSHSFAAIARLSDGEIGAAWLDESFDKKTGGRPVRFAKTNHDNEFDNEIIIDSVACQCCRIAITNNVAGKIAVAFRDIISDSIRDMSVSWSGDNGKTFSRAVPFSHDDWVINGCPHNGPSLGSTGDTIYAAWFTGGPQRGVYYSELNSKMEPVNKQLVSDRGRFIQLCLLKDGSRILTYNDNIQEDGSSYSKIVLNKIEHGQVFADDIKMEKSRASYPVVQPFGTNNVVVSWTSDGKVYYVARNAGTITTAIQRKAATNTVFANNLSQIKLAVSKDLVCGMPLSLSPGDTTLYKERVYGFCSELCKETFWRKPEAYVAKQQKH